MPVAHPGHIEGLEGGGVVVVCCDREAFIDLACWWVVPPVAVADPARKRAVSFEVVAISSEGATAGFSAQMAAAAGPEEAIVAVVVVVVWVW